MRPRIGLAVTRDRITAVAVRGERVVWAIEGSADGSLHDAVTSLLATAPTIGWRTPLVTAVIGPHAAELKLVRGLPLTADHKALSAMIRESPRTFFATGGEGTLTTDVVLAEPGTGLVSAVDAGVVDALVAACSPRWRLQLVGPVAIALPHAFSGETLSWSDGLVAVEVEHRDGRLVSARSRPAWLGSSVPPTPHSLVSGLGDEGDRFALAVGAASLPTAEPLAIACEAVRPWHDRANRSRYTQPVAASAAALLGLVLSPLATCLELRSADRRTAAVSASQWVTLNATVAQLDTVTQRLAELDRFSAKGQSVVRTMAAIARALPTQTALTDLRFRDGAGEATLLTSDSAGTLARINQARDVYLIGDVREAGREMVDGVQLHRLTIRFRSSGATEEPSGR